VVEDCPTAERVGDVTSDQGGRSCRSCRSCRTNGS
jgi:hypothetical protein